MDNNVLNFTDNNVYNVEMAKSAYDKLGFMDKIFEPLDVIVDFGCANGAITRMIKAFYPNTVVIGYDLKEVLEINNLYKKLDRNGIIYTCDLDDVKLAVDAGRSLLVMNSVMHEIFNYMSQKEYLELFNKLSAIKFDYIWIRDFYYENASSERNSGLKSLKDFLNTSEQLKDAFMEFKRWNRLNDDNITWRDMTHFLLKCRYKLNWDKECKEDYWAYKDNWQRVNVTLTDGYRIQYNDSYILPYIEYINHKDFGISLFSHDIRTHRQTLWRRIEE